VVLLVVSRKWALWPFIFVACFVASAQRVVVAGLDFNLLRVLVLFGAARLLVRNEWAGMRWHWIDSLVLAFAVTRTAIYTVQQSSGSAFIFQAGQTFDTVGLYFLFRCLVRDMGDARMAVLGFAAASLPVAAFFLVEQSSGRNMFSVFGGVPEITLVRADRVRCQGAFSHPILAGCFWASLLPMMGAMTITRQRGWQLTLLGACAGLVIVVCCASSTPAAAVMFAAVAAPFYFLRRWMRPVRWALASALVALHLTMEAPVWHLISRVTIAKGNTGYHRYMLIDSAIHHLDEWFLVGTASTAHWFWGAQDITNQFLLEGVRGGFVTMALFIAIVAAAFATAGSLRRASASDRSAELFAWSLGVALFVHCMNFIGVSYFGQTVLVWWLALAMVVSLATAARGGAVSGLADGRRGGIGGTIGYGGVARTGMCSAP
jgi:hypothetical protein